MAVEQKQLQSITFENFSKMMRQPSRPVSFGVAEEVAYERDAKRRNLLNNPLSEPTKTDRALGFIFEKVAKTGKPLQFEDPARDPSETDKRRSTSTLGKYLQEVAASERRDSSRMKLKDFEPLNNPADKDELRERVFQRDYFNNGHESLQELVILAELGERTDRVEELITQVSTVTFDHISNTYHLPNQDVAKNFYFEQMTAAQATYNNLVERYLPERKDAKDNSEVLSPGELVYSLFSSKVQSENKTTPEDEQAQYAALRILNLAELSSVIDVHAREADLAVKIAKETIQQELFGGKPAEPRTIYALFKNETGEPIWISNLDDPLAPGVIEELASVAHLKELTLDVFPGMNGLSDTYIYERTKRNGTASKKAARDANISFEFIGEDSIDPSGLKDFGGIMAVAMDTHSNYGLGVQTFINRQVNMFINELHVSPLDMVRKDETTKTKYQSPDFEFRRFLVPMLNDPLATRDDYPQPTDYTTLECVSKSQLAYYRGEYQFGPGKGPAHALYEVSRSIDVAQLFMPESIYGKIDWDKAEKEALQQKKNDLMKEYAVNISALPEEFKSSEDGLTAAQVLDPTRYINANVEERKIASLLKKSVIFEDNFERENSQRNEMVAQTEEVTLYQMSPN